MARTTELTYEVVAKAADELQQAGIAPSQSQVVKKVGGSNSTVGPLLRKWKAERDAKKAATSTSDTPRHLEVDLAVAAILRRAETAVREELQGDIDEQLSEIEQLTGERDAGRAKVAQLELAVSTLTRERDQLQGQFGQLQRDFDVARQERAQVDDELKDARQAIGQANERAQGLDARVSELTSSEAKLRSEADQLRQRAAAAETGQAEAERRRATAVAELEAKLGVEHKARTDADARVVELLGKLDATAPKLERLAAAEATEKALRDQVEMLKSQVAASEGREREARASLSKREDAAATAAAPKGEEGTKGAGTGGAKTKG
jgi:chromosome segregation ATPase